MAVGECPHPHVSPHRCLNFSGRRISEVQVAQDFEATESLLGCSCICLDPLSPSQTRDHPPSVLPQIVRRGILRVPIRFLFHYLSLPHLPPHPAAFPGARTGFLKA